MTHQEMVALTALPRELAALTGGDVPSYRKLWSLVVDGRLPATQVNGRYQVSRADLPLIVATLGLRVMKAAEPSPKTRKTSSVLVAA